MKKRYLFSSIIFVALLLFVYGRGYATAQGDFVDYSLFSEDGNEENASGYFDGDDEMLTDPSDTETDMYALPSSLNNGLVAYYPFNGNANDASGNGNNGTVYGATLTTDRFGKPNSAYKFDGINDYIEIPQNSTLNPLNQVTIAFWVKINGFTNTWSPIIHKGGTSPSCWSHREYTVWVNNDGLFHSSSASAISCDHVRGNSTAQLAGRWLFYTVVMDRVNHVDKVYINGSLNNSWTDSSSSFLNNSSSLKFGRSDEQASRTDESPFKGLLDDIRIYNRALSAKEIQLLADRPSDHKVAGKNTGWCYPLQDLCSDQMVCKTPVQNVTFGFMSYNNATYPYHYAQDMTKNYAIKKAYTEGDSVFAMAKGRIIKVRRSGSYGGTGWNTMLVQYNYLDKAGVTKPVYVMYGHVKNISGAPVYSSTPEVTVNIPITKYSKIAELNDPGAEWNHVYHLHFSVMPDSFSSNWYAGYSPSQTKNGRVRPFDLWNNTNGSAWSKDWVDINGYQNPANKDAVFFNTYRPN